MMLQTTGCCCCHPSLSGSDSRPSEMCESELEYFPKSFGTGMFQIMTMDDIVLLQYTPAKDDILLLLLLLLYVLLLRISFVLYFTQGPLLKHSIYPKQTGFIQQ